MWHVQRDMYTDHNAQMAVLQKQVADLVQSQTVRTQSTNVVASTIPKDSSTEGEKRAEQEKDGTGDKAKRKASEAVRVTEGELEEGEIHPDGLGIHEPYISYYMENIHHNEDFDECEDTEFMYEFAYDDDCLCTKDGVIQNLEQQVTIEAEKKRRSDQREEQRKKRLENETDNANSRKDVQYKSCHSGKKQGG